MTEPADIVERLRNPPFRTVQTHIENVVSYTLDVDQITDDMREAAAEIDRLRNLLLAGLALHGGEAFTDSEKEWREQARAALGIGKQND